MTFLDKRVGHWDHNLSLKNKFQNKFELSVLHSRRGWHLPPFLLRPRLRPGGDPSAHARPPRAGVVQARLPRRIAPGKELLHISVHFHGETEKNSTFFNLRRRRSQGHGIVKVVADVGFSKKRKKERKKEMGRVCLWALRISFLLLGTDGIARKLVKCTFVVGSLSIPEGWKPESPIKSPREISEISLVHFGDAHSK